MLTRALERQGLLLRDENNPALDLEPADGFEQLLGAAVHYCIATSPHAWRRALTLHTSAPAGVPQPRCASPPAYPLPTAFLTCLHDCPRPMASPRLRLVYSRTGIEPANDDTDTTGTMSIDGLFHLSVNPHKMADGRLLHRRGRDRCSVE